jgi:hypothetical protein
MELTYSTTRGLLARWYWRSLRRNRRHQVHWLFWVALAFVLGALRNAQHPFRSGLLFSTAVIAALALAPQLLFKPQQRVLRVGPEGLATTIGAKSGAFTWRDIARVERNGDYVIVTRHNVNAFIIPVSAFPSVAASEEAITQWQEWQQAAAAQAT